jgi:signal transduction histidine kinase
MDQDALFLRYRELQEYVGWHADDARRVHAVALLLEPAMPSLIDDFYAEIERHPQARRVITGGAEQVERLKGTLRGWLGELLSGDYNAAYVARRWRVGWRHVEIGLDQVFTNVALSRLRTGLISELQQRWTGAVPELQATVRSLDKLLDLDLAIIEDAYQAEYLERQQRTERLAAIGQVAGGIAHELRNPLNVVKTSIYYLLNARNPQPEKKAEHLSRIERQVAVADNVITALSNFARLPIPNLAPFPVEECIREALELNPVPENVEVIVACDALPRVMADRDQVRIVFGNLIRNAREAMAAGGRLTISGRRVHGHVEIAVTDTGAGIAAENLSKIMEPLFSTKARGLGLGLAMSRAILDKNQGSLKVASTPGSGSTFTVALAAAE